MTGAYLRVERRGFWENIEIEHLTDDERALIFKEKTRDEIIQWLDMTCKKLRDNEQVLNELVADGILQTA